MRTCGVPSKNKTGFTDHKPLKASYTHKWVDWVGGEIERLLVPKWAQSGSHRRLQNPHFADIAVTGPLAENLSFQNRNRR